MFQSAESRSLAVTKYPDVSAELIPGGLRLALAP